MDTIIIETILEKKNQEMKELYNSKIVKNKKESNDVNEIDYNTKNALRKIEDSINKKMKSSKAYKKKYDEELLNSTKL